MSMINQLMMNTSWKNLQKENKKMAKKNLMRNVQELQNYSPCTMRCTLLGKKYDSRLERQQMTLDRCIEKQSKI